MDRCRPHGDALRMGAVADIGRGLTGPLSTMLVFARLGSRQGTRSPWLGLSTASTMVSPHLHRRTHQECRDAPAILCHGRLQPCCAHARMPHVRHRSALRRQRRGRDADMLVDGGRDIPVFVQHKEHLPQPMRLLHHPHLVVRWPLSFRGRWR